MLSGGSDEEDMAKVVVPKGPIVGIEPLEEHEKLN